MARGISEPEITKLETNQWAIDFGPPGPFITLPEWRMRGLVNALAEAGWILQDGKPLRPRR